MMTKQKTPKIKAFKLVWAMPIVAILLFAFAEPTYKVIQLEEETVSSKSQLEREIKFSGILVDENGDAQPGVTILVKGTTVGTTSDVDGSFSIDLDENDIIVLSYIGYKTLRFNVDELLLMNKKEIEMKRTAMLLDPEMFIKSSPPPPPPPKKAKGEKAPPPPPLRKQYNEKGEEMIFAVIEAMPEYPGGLKALSSYITEMQQKLAKSEHLKGKVKVGFTVGIDGKVGDLKIISKDNGLVAKGAATIILGMKTWTPGKQRNKPVPVDFILPLEF